MIRASAMQTRAQRAVRNDVGRGVSPSGWQLASDEAAERHSIRNGYACALLESDKSFAIRLSPGVALVTMLEIEFCGLFGNFRRLEVVRKLKFLIKAFPLGLITFEELGLQNITIWCTR